MTERQASVVSKTGTHRSSKLECSREKRSTDEILSRDRLAVRAPLQLADMATQVQPIYMHA